MKNEASTKVVVMHELRCIKCGRKLANAHGTVEIKCPKCGHLATYII